MARLHDKSRSWNGGERKEADFAAKGLFSPGVGLAAIVEANDIQALSVLAIIDILGIKAVPAPATRALKW